MDDATVVDRLETNLMAGGIYVERTALDDETIHLEYETAAGGIPTGQIGAVCSELIESNERGWTPADVHAWAFDLDGQFCGHWRAKAGWFHALDRGYISETDFSTLILSTRATDLEDVPVIDEEGAAIDPRDHSSPDGEGDDAPGSNAESSDG